MTTSPVATKEIEKYYHIQIQKRNGEVSYALNLTEDRVRYVGKRFNDHKTFLLGGIPIDPSNISNIEISVTDDNSYTILRKEREERGFFRVTGGIENFVFEKGQVITSHYIDQQSELGKIENNEKIEEKITGASNSVFIVHGHDDASKTQLSDFIFRLGLKPIILHELPNKGRTLIQKFEESASDVRYAFVLLTPDDICSNKEKEPQSRARQNVLLEMGYFIGKLGLKRVCSLYKKGVEIPSDILGVLFLGFKENVNECRFAIIQELNAAGYNLKLSE